MANVTIENGRVKVGSHTLSIGDALSVATDGERIVVVHRNGSAHVYDMNGSHRRKLEESEAVSCEFKGGFIVLKFKDGSGRRFEPASGAARGNA